MVANRTSLIPLFARRDRAGQVEEDVDLNGPTAQSACAGVSAAGRPRLPCSPTNLVRFRQALGEAGVEELLATTIVVAANMKAVTAAEFERAIVDSIVQEKAIAIAFATDSMLNARESRRSTLELWLTRA
ncbi:hypothetical protein VL15_37865 [Burkholderia cepacia]|uniref:Uncharacterized protein n=1 Tax=Burkholderia cepacia TaxID=292 RepID=A0A0J5W1U7_BURCE|nr:hypothetical protein VL15_37865 [Burkholderia cepacia]